MDNLVVNMYENCKEEDRLSTNQARRVEFIITQRIFEETFPKGGKVLDCAAGTGIYAFDLAEKGYDVTALDLTPRHVGYMRDMLKNKEFDMTIDINDATDLSRFTNETFDIVLCMGPIYHLISSELRMKCLKECTRVLTKGGLLAISYINKFNIVPYIATTKNDFVRGSFIEKVLDTGTLVDGDDDCCWTTSYYSHPNEMENIVRELDMEVVEHFSPDGISPLLRTHIDVLNKLQFEAWCQYQYRVCREKSILGQGNHGLIISRK